MDKKLIILADPEEKTRNLFKTLMEDDYDVRYTNTASEALAGVFAKAPDIIVLNSELGEGSSLDVLRTVRTSPLTNSIPVLVILPEDSVEGKSTFKNVGDCDFTHKPVTPDKLKNEIVSLIRGRNLFGSHLNTKIVTFAGTRGGCGTTTMSVNFALSLLELNHSVLLSESADYFSGIRPALNVKSRRTVPFIMSKETKNLTPQLINESIEKHASGLKVIPAVAAVSDMDNMNNEAIHFMRYNLFPMADIAVVDAGYGLNDAALELFDVSDEVIFVATHDMPSLYNLELIDKVFEGTRLDKSKCHILFNNIHSSGEIPRTKISQLTLKMPILGFIPNHTNGFLKAMNEGEPYLQRYPKNQSAKAIRSIAEDLNSKLFKHDKVKEVA